MSWNVTFHDLQLTLNRKEAAKWYRMAVSLPPYPHAPADVFPDRPRLYKHVWSGLGLEGESGDDSWNPL